MPSHETRDAAPSDSTLFHAPDSGLPRAHVSGVSGVSGVRDPNKHSTPATHDTHATPDIPSREKSLSGEGSPGRRTTETLSQDLRRAIAEAVQEAGGTIADAEDLADVWRRLERDTQARADRMRYEAQHIRCCCADGGQPNSRSICDRCYGRVERR